MYALKTMNKINFFIFKNPFDIGSDMIKKKKKRNKLLKSRK